MCREWSKMKPDLLDRMADKLLNIIIMIKNNFWARKTKFTTEQTASWCGLTPYSSFRRGSGSASSGSALFRRGNFLLLASKPNTRTVSCWICRKPPVSRTKGFWFSTSRALLSSFSTSNCLPDPALRLGPTTRGRFAHGLWLSCSMRMTGSKQGNSEYHSIRWNSTRSISSSSSFPGLMSRNCF